MTTTMTEISAEQIVNRILDGERNFAGTKLGPGQGDMARAGRYAEMNDYLRGLQDLRDNPLDCTGADWSGIHAPGLYFFGTKMAGANLTGAYLSGADLRRVDFTGGSLRSADLSWAVLNQGRWIEVDFTRAMMRGADFYEANFSKARFEGVNMAGAYTLRANFSEADFTGVLLTGCTFYRSDLRRATGLDTARDLGTCEFKHTTVTARERETIEAAIDLVPRFIIAE
jgi:uncharacterized protein YjbI with pentapeptide repeats